MGRGHGRLGLRRLPPREAAEREAGFFSCDGPREPVADLDEGADEVLVATSCKKPGNDGHRATASAANGHVTLDLRLVAAAATEAYTVAGLLAVLGSLCSLRHPDEVVADLD